MLDFTQSCFLDITQFVAKTSRHTCFHCIMRTQSPTITRSPETNILTVFVDKTFTNTATSFVMIVKRIKSVKNFFVNCSNSHRHFTGLFSTFCSLCDTISTSDREVMTTTTMRSLASGNNFISGSSTIVPINIKHVEEAKSNISKLGRMLGMTIISRMMETGIGCTDHSHFPRFVSAGFITFPTMTASSTTPVSWIPSAMPCITGTSTETA